MNFLIFDNELSSLNLINTIITDFHYVTLVTTNQSSLPSSPYLKIEQGDISNASHVIKIVSKHDNDPFDAILIFNLALSTSLNNILQSMERLQGQLPYLFLFFNNHIDENINKILKESSQMIPWMIINCNEINSVPSTKYRIETKFDSKNQQTIDATNLLEFLKNEIKTKKYLHNDIYFYSN